MQEPFEPSYAPQAPLEPPKSCSTQSALRTITISREDDPRSYLWTKDKRCILVSMLA